MEVSGLTKSFGDRRVLDRVTLTLRGGATTGVAGRSGSGKTTLARCLAGLIAPDAGSISLITPAGKRSVVRPSPAIQLVFQEPQASFDPRLSLVESLAEAVRFEGATLDRRSTVVKALSCLDQVGIDNETARRRPGEVSGGECQRAAIARTLLRPPTVVVADEPTSGLDSDWSARILSLLCEAQRRHRFALLVISHDIGLLSAICIEMAVMDEGRIVEHGGVQQTIRKPVHPVTAELIEAGFPLRTAMTGPYGQRHGAASSGTLERSD